MKQYLSAVREVLTRGTRKENRTGVDTISTFNINYEIDLEREGFPLLTTKRMSWKNIVVENLWFLSGERHVEILHKHDCHFWDAWTDGAGWVPSAYGNLWRCFPVPAPGAAGRPAAYNLKSNDQIQWAVDELRRNPMSRRVVVSAWAPGNAQTSKLPPCHVMMVFNVQNFVRSCPDCARTDPNPDPYCDSCGGYGEKHPRLCLHLTQRSCDMALGVPYNIAGYALLLEMMGRFTGIKPGIFAHTLVDAHVYTCKPNGTMENHDHVPGLRDQLGRSPRPLPRLKIGDGFQSLEDVHRVAHADTDYVMSQFVLEGYNPHPAIKFKVAV